MKATQKEVQAASDFVRRRLALDFELSNALALILDAKFSERALQATQLPADKQDKWQGGQLMILEISDLLFSLVDTNIPNSEQLED